jgi:hypothetical protein
LPNGQPRVYHCSQGKNNIENVVIRDASESTQIPYADGVCPETLDNRPFLGEFWVRLIQDIENGICHDDISPAKAFGFVGPVSISGLSVAKSVGRLGTAPSFTG